MFECSHRPDPRIPGMGLAFFRVDAGGHRAVEHGGILPRFNSQFFAAPDDGVAVMTFTNGASGAMWWLPGETAGLFNAVLDVRAAEIRTDRPQRPEVWADICGRYRLPGPLGDVRTRLAYGAGVEVGVRRGRLMLRVLSPIPLLYKGFVLHPETTRRTRTCSGST